MIQNVDFSTVKIFFDSVVPFFFIFLVSAWANSGEDPKAAFVL